MYKVEIIKKEDIPSNLFVVSDNSPFNLWPVKYDGLKYHTARLHNIPGDQLIFFAVFFNGNIKAVVEVQHNNYDTKLLETNAVNCTQFFFDIFSSPVEKEEVSRTFFSFFQSYREKNNIGFCFLALNNWENILSQVAQSFGFKYILTWGSCFYNDVQGTKLPGGFFIDESKKEKDIPHLLEMSKDYFKGGRFYSDLHISQRKADQLYTDLIENCYSSDEWSFTILRNEKELPCGCFIWKKLTYNFENKIDIGALRFLLYDKRQSAKGLPTQFLIETSNVISAQTNLVTSGIEFHNLPSLKIHVNAGYKFNYVYSAYHSWT